MRPGEQQLLSHSSELVDPARFILQSGLTLRLRAPGKSMQPSIGDGDVITLSPCTFSELRLGDLVSYVKPDGCLIVHRVIAISRRAGQEHLVAMGDNAYFPDLQVRPEQVLGRVLAVERAGHELRVGGRLQRWRALLRNRGRWYLGRARRALRRGESFLRRPPQRGV